MHKPSDFRRIYLFHYEFRESKSLEDVLEKLKGKFEFLKVEDFQEIINQAKEKGFIARDFEDAIVMRSLAVEPPMVYFILFHENEKGGKILLLETKDSWYTHEKILLSMRSYSRNAGINCRYIKFGQFFKE